MAGRLCLRAIRKGRNFTCEEIDNETRRVTPISRRVSTTELSPSEFVKGYPRTGGAGVPSGFSHLGQSVWINLANIHRPLFSAGPQPLQGSFGFSPRHPRL